MRKVLIVVDMQNDFVSGMLGTPEAQAIIPNVKKKIEEYKSRGDRIIFTRDTHKADYLETREGKYLPVEHCIHGTPGWCVVNELEDPSCTHIDKETFGYTSWEYILDWETLTDKLEIELVGVCTSICVVSNALILKALYPDSDITVDASCCACVNPESHKHALDTMSMCQINIIGE